MEEGEKIAAYAPDLHVGPLVGQYDLQYDLQ